MPPATSHDADRTSEEVKQKIARDLKEREGFKHNYGQAKPPPHATADNYTGKAIGQFYTDCAKEHRESLQCIERNYQNRSACDPFFDAYKACRKEENDRRMEANANSGRRWFS